MDITDYYLPSLCIKVFSLYESPINVSIFVDTIAQLIGSIQLDEFLTRKPTKQQVINSFYAISKSGFIKKEKLGEDIVYSLTQKGIDRLEENELLINTPTESDPKEEF